MIRKLFRLLKCLIITNFKFLLIKIFHFKHFKYNVNQLINPTTSIDIQDKGTIELGRKVNFYSNNTISVRENGYLKISDGVFLNTNCYIVAHNKIVIGKDVCIGPNTVIVDHDHKFDTNGVDKKQFNSKKVIIGQNTWIGANVVILKGTHIGKNSIISAGSVVNCDVPDNSVFIQKRKSEIINIKR